jgi:APA family basic amino acid/polyamine antiporter
MGQYRQLPDRLRTLHPKFRTPYIAILLFGFIACLTMLPGQASFLGTVYAYGAMLSFTMAHAAVIKLRISEPDAERPYRVWGYPWTTGIALLGSAGFLIANVAGDTRNSLRSIAILALSFPVFLLVQRATRSRA